MSENRRLRLIIIMILVGAIVGATLAMPLWIDQITGTSRPEEDAKTPYFTRTSELDNVALADNESEATSTPTNTLPAPITGGTNCVRDVSYWLSHQDYWPFEEIRIADKSFSKPEAVLIIRNETQDPTQLLLRQLLVYTLNIQFGADQRNVLDFVIEAHNWLYNHPTGSVVTQQDQQWASEMIYVLSEFNQGNLGPGLCPKDTATLTPSPTTTPTQTDTPTITPSATSTNTPIVTLPPIYFTPFPEGGPKPISTSDPDEDEPEEPTQPPPEPTDPPPEPTDPPPEPTDPPPPEPTEVELPTAAPTDEP